MTLAPVISGNIFNLIYGRIYDHHSTIVDGQRVCPDGLNCYHTAYWVTFGASLVGIVVSLWSVRRDHVRKGRLVKERADEGREA